MLFHFSFKHMETSVPLQNYAEEKIREKVEKFVTKAIDAHVFFSVQRHEHTAHLSLKAGDGFSIEMEQTSSDMYVTVDQLVDKLGVYLQRQKEKLKAHKLPKSIRNLHAAEVGVATHDYHEDVDAEDIVKYEQARQRAGAR